MDFDELHFQIAEIDLSRLSTDDDFRREARERVPDALNKMGEVVGEKMWNETQKAFKGSGFTKSSETEKRQFIAKAGENLQREAEEKLKNDIEDYLVEQIRKQKADISNQ